MKMSVLLTFLVFFVVVACNEQYPAGVIKPASSTTATTTPTAAPTVTDTDGDGFEDVDDNCDNDSLADASKILAGAPTNSVINGCLDSDWDGIINGTDVCTTPTVYTSSTGVKTTALAWTTINVDSTGCSDIDVDGLPDGTDRCDVFNILSASTISSSASYTNTPTGATVSALGCPSDTDNDGVYNGLDICPSTPSTATAIILTTTTSTVYGCADVDGDGYYELQDSCPNELAPSIGFSNGTRDSTGCLYGFEVKLQGGNNNKKVLHRAGLTATTATTSTVAADRRCMIYADKIDSSFSLSQPIATATSDLLCWLDIEELELASAVGGFNLNLVASPGLCEYVWYDPYYFYQWNPGPETATGNLYSVPTATYTYVKVDGKDVGYRRRAYRTSITGATSCGTCVIPAFDHKGVAVPLGGLTTDCQNESVPASGSTFCPFDHTASSGPNCDQNHYAVITYDIDYVWLDGGTDTRQVPGTTALSLDYSSQYFWFNDSNTEIVATACSTCYTDSTMTTSTPTCSFPLVPSSDAGTLSTIMTNSISNSCQYNYSGGFQCDDGSVTITYNKIVKTSDNRCFVDTSVTSSIGSCGGNRGNCICTLANTTTSASTPGNWYNLDGNPANDHSTVGPDTPWKYEIPVSCGGNRNSCIQGPGKSYVNGQGLPIGQLQSSILGLSTNYSYTMPGGMNSSMYLANWLSFEGYNSAPSSGTRNPNTNGVNSCLVSGQYAPEVLSSTYSGSSITATVAGPHKGTQPFYTFYCLDGAFDVRARIRVQVRDWDKTLSNVSGTTYTYKTETGTRTGADIDDGFTNVLGNLHSDYFDWDDLVLYPNGRPVSGTSGFTIYGVSTTPTAGNSPGVGTPSCFNPLSTYPFPNRNL